MPEQITEETDTLSRRAAWADAAMTWPSLRVQIHLFPWSWRLLPRGWSDYTPRRSDSAGWWSLTGQWLAFEVDFGFNLPPFERPVPPTPKETP